MLQGERPMATDNKSLGRFILDGIPPAPRGVPQVEVTFDIDANGILNVKAKDNASGKEQSIKITGSTGLSKEEVEKMTKDAEANAKEDAEKKEKIDVRNQADTLIFTTEKTMREDKDNKIPEDLKKELEEKLKALKDILESGSKEDIQKKTQELSDILQKVGAGMYQQEGPQDGEAPKDADGAEKKDEKKKGEEPVEGEVVE